MKRKAYSYIRMSTDLQLKGDSLRRQLELSKNYADEHQLELVSSIDGRSLFDIGVSGFRGKNTEKGVLGYFLEALYSGKIEKNSVLLIESLDRLSRDKVTASLAQFLQILENEIEIVTLADNQRYTKDSINQNTGSLFVSLGIMMRANEESETKSKRLKAVWQNKRENISSKALTSRCPAWIKYDKSKNVFELDAKKAAVVKLIFSMCTNTCGLFGITRYLNESKTPVFGRGKMWHKSYVSKILKNRSTIGEFQPGVRVDGKQMPIGDTIIDYYPKVVSESEFLAANAALDRRDGENRGRKGENYSNIFSGLVYCGKCNSKMMLRNRGSSTKGGKTLCCSRQRHGLDCDMPEWKLDLVEQNVLQHLYEIDFSSIKGDGNSPLNELDVEISALSLKKSELESVESKALDLILDVDLNSDSKGKLVQKANAARNEITNIRELIESLHLRRAELVTASNVFSSNQLKTLVSELKSRDSDYYFRSALNEVLSKAISKIELVEDPFVFQPWDFTEYSAEVETYRSMSLKRKNISLNVLVERESFKKHCKMFAQRIVVKYKSGEVRFVDVGNNMSFKNIPMNVWKKKNLLKN